MKTAIGILAAAMFAVAAAPILAGPPALVDRQTGKYLGNLGGNKYDPNSTSNGVRIAASARTAHAEITHSCR